MVNSTIKKLFLILMMSFILIGLASAENNQNLNTQQYKNNGMNEGNILTNDEEPIQITSDEQNRVQLRTRNMSVHTNFNIIQEQEQDRLKLMVQLSNGRNAEIKIMPSVASEIAIARLQIKMCNQSNNCTIELKEVGIKNETRLAYEVKVQKQSKILWLFKRKMEVKTEINAENGEVIAIKKPWWSFLAKEYF